MDDEYKLISTKLLDFELQGAITQEQKATLASAISRILHEAVRKRDALKLVDIQALEARLDKLEPKYPPVFQVPHFEIKDQKFVVKNETKKKVFIVHGHDEAMKQAVARVLEKLELDPIILHEMPNMGRTIIEKFTDYSDVNYAVVLLSPDDIGYSKKDGKQKAKPRARQNVIFEPGFFLGKIERKNVAVLYLVTDNFEIPTDYQGVTYIPYDNYESWKYTLVGELKSCGYDVDANRLINIH